MIGRRSAASPALPLRHSDIVDAPVAAQPGVNFGDGRAAES
jgi:hypothetical protein